MIDTILNMDCRDGLKDIPDNYVDLIVMDPPYEFKDTRGGGSFGSEKRTYHSELDPLSKGVTQEILDVLCDKMKAINIYIWCNKNQLRQYIDYFDDRGCNIDLLTWHKTNPVPMCSNKYLSDTEYCVFARESGVKVYGTYETKRKWYASELNTADKKAYGHPTVKPLNIIKNLVLNSSRGGDLVLDPFMGSGTTAVAAKLAGRHYLGFEIDSLYYETAVKRVEEVGVGGWF